MHHSINKWLSEWWQNILAASASGAAIAQTYMPAVNSMLASILTICTILWTFEKWRDARLARRTAEIRLEQFEDSVHSAEGKHRMRRILDRITGPAELDDAWRRQDDAYDGQSHHQGK
jgi:hypothetical protein